MQLGHCHLSCFTPGAAAAVTFCWTLAPELKGGTIGTWVTAASGGTCRLPAARWKANDSGPVALVVAPC